MTDAEDPFAHLHDERSRRLRCTRARARMPGAPRWSRTDAARRRLALQPDPFERGGASAGSPIHPTRPANGPARATGSRRVARRFRCRRAGTACARNGCITRAVPGMRATSHPCGAPAVAWCCAWVRRPASRACSSTTSFLGLHRGHSTPFCVELTGALRPGANRLLIGVDNTRLRNGVPMRHFDWFNYGGLHREVDAARSAVDVHPRLQVALVRGAASRVRGASCCPTGRNGAEVLKIPHWISAGSRSHPGSRRASSPRAGLVVAGTPDVARCRAIRQGPSADRVGFRGIAMRGEASCSTARRSVSAASRAEDDRARGRVRARRISAAASGSPIARLQYPPARALPAPRARRRTCR